jgi:hypothetical protein
MARFNPPPGWPVPPDGWRPPAGWQPDPTWPRPPDSWQWWLPDPLGRQQGHHAGSSQALAPTARGSVDTVLVSESLLAVTGLVVIIGSVMPWVSLGPLTASGTIGDGIITLVLGIAIAVCALLVVLARARWAAIVALVLGAAVAVTAIVDMINISSLEIFDTRVGMAFIGGGLWLTLAGGLLAVGVAIAAIVVTARGRQTSRS